MENLTNLEFSIIVLFGYIIGFLTPIIIDKIENRRNRITEFISKQAIEELREYCDAIERLAKIQNERNC